MSRRFASWCGHADGVRHPTVVNARERSIRCRLLYTVRSESSADRMATMPTTTGVPVGSFDQHVTRSGSDTFTKNRDTGGCRVDGVLMRVQALITGGDLFGLNIVNVACASSTLLGQPEKRSR